jgi:hypothetical protein
MRRAWAAVVLASIAFGASSVTYAQPRASDTPSVPRAMQLPFGDTAAAVDPANGEIFVVVLGAADERHGPLSASRLSARRLAEQRGRESLHAFVDAAVERVHLSPSVLSSLHEAIDREAHTVTTRPRVDGSANVRVSIAMASLRAITGSVRGLPWSS